MATDPSLDPSLDDLIASLQPVLRTLAKLAHAQGAPAPMVSIHNGTVAIVPAAHPYANFAAEEWARYRRDALRGAHDRARQYTQRTRRPQVEAAKTRAARWTRSHPHG
jgi:hypothetical protein